MLSFLIVGSGYRSEYYARVVHTWPEQFKAMYLCRSEEKAALMRRRTGLPATVRLEECLAFKPDFAVVAVDRGHIAAVTEEWALRGFPVVCETPVGASWEELDRLWELSQQGARIVCCEQYPRHPILAAGLEAVAQGLIGDPTSCSLSLLHDYHAAGMIRRLLLAEGESYTLRGETAAFPITETDSRQGAILDGRVGREQRTVLYQRFSSGKTAVYDFAPAQYRSFIRSRHLTVRGTRGEWSDTVISYLDADQTPRRRYLTADLPPRYRCLDTQNLKDIRKTWTPELFLDTLQDEYAIATILLDMGEYLSGGPSPYPMEAALEDACFWLLAQEAAENPWQEISPPQTGWRKKEMNAED